MSNREINWRKYVLHPSLEVVCCIDKQNPHLVKVKEFLLAGVGEKLPYTFCPEHQAYFGVSVTVDMRHKIIKLKDLKELKDLIEKFLEEERK